MPGPPDFETELEGVRPFLDETTAGALLQSASVRRRRTHQAWAIGREELAELGDLGRLVIPTPLDRAEASVTNPIVKNDDEMVLGVLFVLYASRSRVHYVLSSPNKWEFRSCSISWLQA